MSPQQADNFFYQKEMENREKQKIFVYRSVPENFQREKFSGQVPTKFLRTEDSEYVYERGVEIFFGGVLPARSWEMPVERRLPAKIGRCGWAVTILALEQNFLHEITLYAIDINKLRLRTPFLTL